MLEAIAAVIVFGLMFIPLVNTPFGLIAGSAASSSNAGEMLSEPLSGHQLNFAKTAAHDEYWRGGR